MTDFSWDRRPFSRRSLFAAGGATAAALALAACGDNTGRASSSSGSGSGGDVTLKQWYHAYGEDGVKEAVEKYAADYKDAKVTVSWLDGYDDKLGAALLKASEAPDVYEAQVKIDRIKAGQCADVTDLIADTKDDWVENALAANTVDGKLYAIPQAVDMQLLVYRPSLLSKAGFSSAPSSLSELAAAAKALTTSKMKGLFVGNDGGAGVFATPALYAAGLSLITPDKKVGFDAASAADVMKQLQELKASGSLLLGAPNDWFAPDALINEQCAMQWTGLWTFPQIKEKFGDDFAVAGFPAVGSSGKTAVPFGAFNAHVFGKGANVEAAKAFVKWLWVDGIEMQTEFETKFGFHIPPRKSIADKAENLKSGQAADAVKLYQESGYNEGPYWIGAISQKFTDAVSNIITKNADPASELKTAVEAISKELAKL